MKKLFLYIVSLFIIVGCSDEIPEQKRPIQAKRAILAYLIANNNLDIDIMNNVVWMYESLAKSQDSCSLAIYYKPSSSNNYINEAQILTFFTDGHGQINGQHPTSWMPATGTDISTFSFGYDGVERNSINIPEFADVLETCFPGNLDFVLFDACMMQTAEVCYELRNATHYCIASVMETPVDGFPYHLILNNLYQEDIDFDKLCEDVITYNKKEKLWGTYAVVDCTQMDAFAAAVREEITSKASLLENLSLHSIQQYGVNQFSYFSFDVADLIRQLNEGILPDSFQQILNQTVLTKSCITNSNANPYGSVLRDEEKYCGIGMYIPDAANNPNWNAYYRSAISWYQAVWGN